MTHLEITLLIAGVCRVGVWSIGVAVCWRIKSTIGQYAFGLFAVIAALNTLRDSGIVTAGGTVSHVSQLLANPATALMVATLILNHRSRQ